MSVILATAECPPPRGPRPGRAVPAGFPPPPAPYPAPPPWAVENGNIMAVWHRALPDEQAAAFRRDLEHAGLAWAQCEEDAAPGAALARIPFWRLDWYRTWFLARGYNDLFFHARRELDGAPAYLRAFGPAPPGAWA